MILRIGRGHIKPGTWDAFERVYHDVLVDREQPPGLRARWLVRDVDDEHGGFTVAVWDDADSVSAWLESDDFAVIQEAMRPFYVGDYQVRTCDVRVHEAFDGG
jgi:heme-degrading monooxygenase HmoA